MDRSTLKVFVRAKGQLKQSSITLSKDLHEITISDPLGKDPSQVFDFFRIFVESTQEEIFEISTRPIIEHVLDGFDGLIMLYGPTDTGKTHTIIGHETDPGLYARSIQAIFEETEKIKSQKDISTYISVIELYNNSIRDLGSAFKDPHAISTFQTQQLDIVEIKGRVMAANSWEIQVKTMEEALSVVKQAGDLRAALEARQGKYVYKAHTIIAVKLKQKYKTSAWDQFSESVLFLVQLPGSEKPKNRKDPDFYDSHNALGSFHALAKCFSNLNSVSNNFSENKITRLLENAFKNNSQIALIGTINIYKENNEETIRTLSYLDKCKVSSISTVFGDGINSDMEIKLLQDERAALKEKLKKVEATQEIQIKKITKLLGVDYDIDILLQAQQGSKELQKISIQKEAVSKIDSLMKKNRELEKRVEETKTILTKIRKIDFQKQEKHLREVLEIKDELNRYKDLIEEVKASHEHEVKTQVNTKAFELNSMVSNSQKLLEEKIGMTSKFHKSITSNLMLPNNQAIKDLGRQEAISEYNRRLNEQEKNNNEYYDCLKKKYEMLLDQRLGVLEDMHVNFEKGKESKEVEIGSLKKEIKMMFDVVKAQKNVIENIRSGEYNQHLAPIEFPESILPEFPDEKKFPK